MKLPEPVCEIVDWDSMGSPYIHWNINPGSITSLFTETQMREALAQQEAVMRMALGVLHETGHHSPSEAIKALEDALK